MKERFPSLTMTILKRELLTGLRSWKSFILLLAMLAVLYGAAFVAMDTATTNYIFMSGVMRSLFTMQVVAAGAIVFAVVPAMAAVSINSERQEENYDLLLTTLITPRRIVLGKYVAVIIRAVLIVTAILPFTGLVYFYAGVDTASFYSALAVLVPAALCNAAIGIWCSDIAQRPARSIFMTFGIIAFLAGLIPVSTTFYYRQIQPFATLGAFATQATENPLLLYIAYQLVACALFLMGTLFRFRDFSFLLRVRSQAPGSIGENGTGRLSRAMRPPFRPIPDGANPLGYKDLCGSAARNAPMAGSMFGVTISAYFLLYAWIARETPEILLSIGFLERIGIVILVPPMIAVLMVREKESTTFDMLRMSLLGATDLVMGKIAVLLRLLKPVLLAVLFCKIIILLRVGALTGLDRLNIPLYFFVVDFLLLPVNLLFVVVASILGAALPKRLIPAIGGASGTTLFATFLLLYMQFSMMTGGSGNDTDFATVFLITHLMLAGFGCLALGGLAMALISGQWNIVGEPPTRSDWPAQPPSFPE